jgi:heme O synthase-like polyprenyltransferase
MMIVASANTLNCYLERDSDRWMCRTRDRPLPAGRIRPESALSLGLWLFVLSLPLLWSGGQALTAVLGCIAHLGYVVEESYRYFYEGTIKDIEAWLGGKPINLLNPEALKTA